VGRTPILPKDIGTMWQTVPGKINDIAANGMLAAKMDVFKLV